MRTRLNQAHEQLYDLHRAGLEAGRKELCGPGTRDVEDWRIELRLHLLKVLSDGLWHSSLPLEGVADKFIPPERAARADPGSDRCNVGVGRGRPIIVTRELQDLLIEKRIEKRSGNGRTAEWRLVDRAWAEQVLARTNGIRA